MYLGELKVQKIGDLARQILGKRHLKISRQRKDHAVKLAGVRNLIKRCSRLRKFENQKYGEESLFS